MTLDSFELISLKSGHSSLRLSANGETFHPVIGPEAEARLLHVEQQKLYERAQAGKNLVIWDVGLGAAANAIAAIERLHQVPAAVELHSFDRTTAPLAFALEHAEQLSYLLPYREAIRQLISCGQVQVGSVRWHWHPGDFRESMALQHLPPPDSIFYDPYSAQSNAEMWTLEHFHKLRQLLLDDRPCLLTNYTRSTAVRCTWLLAGFYVGIGTGIGEKNQTTIASNRLDALQCPLPTSWLKQVLASQNANPLRAQGTVYGPMSATDFAALEQHPQFFQK